MESRCQKCGGELITGTLRTKSHLSPICFTPLEDLNKAISSRNLDVLCDLCTQCGSIENIRVEDPGKLGKA